MAADLAQDLWSHHADDVALDTSAPLERTEGYFLAVTGRTTRQSPRRVSSHQGHR
ncbi:hypothetical protein ACFXPY_45995 [Streptomyces sp. NPDC059153]|uniref:hypothetical protein n=1 Tax=unclassified Streptomyces TaxID=2593676 RepID=UPI00368457D2